MWLKACFHWAEWFGAEHPVFYKMDSFWAPVSCRRFSSWICRYVALSATDMTNRAKQTDLNLWCWWCGNRRGKASFSLNYGTQTSFRACATKIEPDRNRNRVTRWNKTQNKWRKPRPIAKWKKWSCWMTSIAVVSFTSSNFEWKPHLDCLDPSKLDRTTLVLVCFF